MSYKLAGVIWDDDGTMETKKLSPLEALKYLKENKRRHWLENDKSNECLDIIESALKHLEALEQELCVVKTMEDLTIEAMKDKKIKALEIIKEKRVDVCYFMNCKTLEEYNDDVLASYAYEEVDAEQRMLTQEEFDLLKEEL